MRRLFTIAIALLLSFTLAAPLFGASASTTLPACCRRSGAHHCMGRMVTDPGPGREFSAIPNRCPRFPIASTAPQTHSFVPNRSLSTGIPLFTRPMALPQTEARYRVSFARSRQKRGPPVILL
jgi:hypothetical protein